MNVSSSQWMCAGCRQRFHYSGDVSELRSCPRCGFDLSEETRAVDELVGAFCAQLAANEERELGQATSEQLRAMEEGADAFANWKAADSAVRVARVRRSHLLAMTGACPYPFALDGGSHPLREWWIRGWHKGQSRARTT